MAAPTKLPQIVVKADRPVRNLKNIGPKLAQYLAEIGVETESQLREKGVVPVYRALGVNHPHLVNRMALYALYGALSDQNCMHLPEETKHWLEEELDKDDSY
jgi:hypothetical protein